MSDDYDKLIKEMLRVLKAAEERDEEVTQAAELANKIGELIEGESFGLGMEALIMISVKCICAIAENRMHAMGLSAHMCRQILHGCETMPVDNDETKLQ